MKTVLDSLNEGLLSAMSKDPSVILLGEDILDPYGGAFKVTRGCSSAFPDRVLAAPISEAGLAGVTAGLSLRGLRPVLEIMFGDFTTLIADQLINHIAKFRWMYNNTVNLPLVIRTPMGGRRGYGPTHSQTLEKLFLGVPGLKVWAPTHFCDHQDGLIPGSLLEKAILKSDDPVLFIENKLQYLLPLIYAEEQTDLDVQVFNNECGSYSLKIGMSGAPTPKVTLVGYGYMAELARQAMLKLAYEEEIFCELIVFTELSPFNINPLEMSLARTGRLVTLEEGGLTLGWGAEILARVTESSQAQWIRAARVSAMDLPVAAALALEQAILPQLEDILTAVRKVAFNEG